MQESLIQYCLTRPKPTLFSDEVMETFADESRWGAIYVEENSAREAQFLEIASQQGLLSQLSKYNLTFCNSADIAKHEFFYLSTKEDKTYKAPHFFGYDQHCFANREVICRTGVGQTSKIELDLTKTKTNLDIMHSPYFPHPLLISRRLKSLLEEENITGYRTVPCLEKGAIYPNEYALFDSTDNRLDGEAAYYQLIVTSKVKRNPRVGPVLIVQQCPVCDTVQGFYPDLTTSGDGEFRLQDFADADIQIYDGFISDEIGEFNIANGFIIVSARLLSLLAAKSIRGLSRYSCLFKLPYRAVNVDTN